MPSKPQLDFQPDRRIKKVFMNAMASHVIFPWFVSNCLLMFAVVLVLHSLYPRMDVNDWPFLGRGLLIWSVLSFVTMYGFFVFWVRMLIYRKGALRIIQHVFPRAISGTDRWLDRYTCWALGIRGIIQQARAGSNTARNGDTPTA